MRMVIFNIVKKVERKLGFSLPEMLVTLAIFSAISVMMLSNYSGYVQRIEVDTLAHEIGQWVRDAQISAMSVRPSLTSNTIFPGYGLHFEVATNNRFIYFADVNNNFIYDLGDTEEKIVTLNTRNTIYSLCGATPSQVIAAPCTSLGKTTVADIVFRRPDPDAIINGNLDGAGTARYSRMQITIKSQKGYTRIIDVWVTGQISIK